MIKIIISALLLAAAALLLVFRSQQREQLQRVEQAEAAAEEAEARAADATLRSDRIKREMLKLQAEQLLRPHRHAAGSTNAPEDHPAARLFRDPEIRASLRKQHVKAVERTARELVGSNLVQQLRLTPEQAVALRELVKRKHAPGFEMTFALMSGELADAELAETGRTMRERRNAADTEIRELLGTENYAIYSWHEDSQAERGRVNEFRNRIAEAAEPLTAEQEDALIRIMYDERIATPFTHDFHNPQNFDMDRLPEIFSEPSLDEFIGQMEELNNRIIVRAQTLLSPGQSGEFAQALRDHFERSKTTVKMTAAMFPVRRRN